MSQEHLGLFDTPPTRNEIRTGVVVVLVLVLAAVAILPFSATRLPQSRSFVPTVNAIIFVGDLIVATLLFAQALVFRSRALIALGSGFLFIALLVIPYVLTFPGAFAPNGLLGAGTNSAAWIMIFRRMAFPLMIILYVLLRRVDWTAPPELQRSPYKAGWWVSGAIALAVSLSVLAIAGHDLLPAMFRDQREGVYSHLLLFNSANIVVILIAMVLLWRAGNSVLDLWLMVALAGWLIQSLLNLPLQARFTLGFYSLHVLILISHLILLVALIAETNQLYARLALTTAAHGRERETRMMSMDAMAAAMSQEVGQPLAAVNLSARAALNWLTGDRPAPERAVHSLRDIIDAGHRTFDALNSVRVMFGKHSGSVTVVDVNDLIQETALLLDRELAAHRISVELDLDEKLPPILANRVQLQRVLVHLLLNAIESIGETRRRRTRHIAIRSSVNEARKILLEVSDTGAGISPQHLERLFEPYFTTKTNGSGLGLSLSRTFVEENGGRLWAISGDDGGATFHLELPLRTLA